jgi:hypothetical protein
MMGLEPTTTGITIRYSNQLSYTHRRNRFASRISPRSLPARRDDARRCCRFRPVASRTRRPPLARPTGLEPATVGLEGRCSIRLSYGRISSRIVAQPRQPAPSTPHEAELVGVEGFEPTTPCSQSRCATRLRYTPPFARPAGASPRPKGAEILRTAPVSVNERAAPRKNKGCRSTLGRCRIAAACWRARRDSNSRPPSS